MPTIRGVDPSLDARLSDDIEAALKSLTPADGHWLVKTYFLIQETRIRTANQTRARQKMGEPHRFIKWTFLSMQAVEVQIKQFLQSFAQRYRVGNWLLAQYGIGPVLASACLTMFDIRKAPAAGNFWSFAGLSPHIVWQRGQKRPYNAHLKSIMVYRLGETMVKFSGRPECFYGALYRQKREEITALNEQGYYAEYAKGRAQYYRVGTEARKALDAGRLPQGQIHARARRWAVKMFLSHLHSVMYEDYYGTPPPSPYAIVHLGHKDVIPPPLWPLNSRGVPYSGLSMKDLLADIQTPSAEAVEVTA